MKIYWHDGALVFRPTTVREHNALSRLHRAMGGQTEDGDLVDLWVSSVYPREGEPPSKNILIDEYATTYPPLENEKG
jgi:hypothetical protein